MTLSQNVGRGDWHFAGRWPLRDAVNAYPVRSTRPASAAADIERFVAQHRPLAQDVQLADATFWTLAQAQFLREGISEDADWAEVVDQLNVMLRA